MAGFGVGKAKNENDQKKLRKKVGTGYMSRIAKLSSKREKKLQKFLEELDK